MTNDQLTNANKIGFLKLAVKLGNVSEACSLVCYLGDSFEPKAKCTKDGSSPIVRIPTEYSLFNFLKLSPETL